MLLHDLRLTLRSLSRRKGYALLHVLGLAAGLAACLVVLLYAAHELTYDRFHPGADQIYSTQQHVTSGSRTHTMDGVSNDALDLISQGIAGVESVMRAEQVHGAVRVPGGDPFEIDWLLRADPTFFDFFGFDLARGSSAQVLADPGSIVLTQSTARTLFGDMDPVGRTVEFLERGFMDKEEARPLTVSGVAADPPGNSTVRFDALTRFVPNPDPDSNAFDTTPTYLRLAATADTAAVLATLRTAGLSEDDDSASLTMMRLVDAHLTPNPGWEDAPTPLRYVYLFGAIALVLLVIAVINYVNLATAYASQRRAEVGVRKTLGASRGELGRLFWLEALLLAGVAGLIALALSLGAPWLFRSFFGFELGVTPFSHPALALGLMGVALATGVLAGAYPALYLARQRPVAALRGQRAGGGLRLRQGLVVVQFALAVAMVSATWIVGDQLDLGRDLLMGSGSQTLVLNVGSESAADIERLTAQVRAAPGVEQVVRSSAAPGAGGFSMAMPLSTFTGGEAVEGEESVMLQAIASDAAYIPFYDLALTAGRAPREGETNVAVLNETALATFQMGDDPEAALGRTIHLSSQPHEVIGVARDFYMRTVESKPGAAALIPFPTDAMEMGSIYGPRAVSVSVLPGQTSDAVDAIQDAWRGVFPDAPFAYKWIDDVFAQAYKAERRTQAVFGFAAALALVLACMGLFGLTAFAAMQRRKEIGVRKVLGAGVARLVGLMTRDFALLVLVGFALAVPAAYVLMGKWLEGFAERAPMRPGVFIGAGALVLVVALATVGYHALRAATVNPADVLRDE